MWLVWLLACTGGDPADTGLCATAPTVTYETFGAGFVTENCQSCHASTTPDRNGAPADVTFDSAADVWAHREEVLETAAVDPPTMPPLGGTTEEDRELLTIWLTCADEGT